MYRLEYRGLNGGEWWVGHRGVELKDAPAYVSMVNRPGASIWEVRAIDLETGEIIGDATPCAICGDAHSGPDGSCLL